MCKTTTVAATFLEIMGTMSLGELEKLGDINDKENLYSIMSFD